jgi:hypothetical protein
VDNQISELERLAQNDTSALVKLLQNRCRIGNHVWMNHRSFGHIGKEDADEEGFAPLFKRFDVTTGFSIAEASCLVCSSKKRTFRPFHGGDPVLLELMV